MFIFLYIEIVFSFQFEMSSEYIYEECSKFEVCLNSLPVHKGAISLTIFIQLYDMDGENSEYPLPFPYILLGEDYIPTDKHYSYSLSLQDFAYEYVYIEYPRYTTLVFSLNGGLTDSFRVFPAYTPKGWVYIIFVRAVYCENNFYAGMLSDYYCTEKLQETSGSLSTGTHYMEYEVQEFTNTLTIQILSIAGELYLDLGPRNFGGINYTIDSPTSITIKYPQSGPWLIIFQTNQEIQYQITFEPCTYFHHWICGDDHIYLRNPRNVELITEDMQQYSFEDGDVSIIGFYVSDRKHQYAVDTTCNGNISHNYPSLQSDSTDYACGFTTFGYLPVGLHFLKISQKVTDIYSIVIYESTLGMNMCNSQLAKLSGNVGYVCDCSQNTGGVYCEKATMDLPKYMLGVVMLSGSNLFMLGAVFLTIYRGLYGEAAVFASNMIVSLVYHICDYEYYCILEEIHLRLMDFMLSYLSVMTSLLYLGNLKNANVKMSIIFCMFLFQVFIAFFYEFRGFYFEVMVIFIQPIVVVVAINICANIYRVISYSLAKYRTCFTIRMLRPFLSKNFDWRWIIPAVMCLMVALYAKLYRSNHLYWIVFTN